LIFKFGEKYPSHEPPELTIDGFYKRYEEELKKKLESDRWSPD
jgi:hypothetical protein